MSPVSRASRRPPPRAPSRAAATSPTTPGAGSRRPPSEIGYIASPDAASLVTGRTKNVGVIIPFVNRWFFGEVLEGIERALLRRRLRPHALQPVPTRTGPRPRLRLLPRPQARRRGDRVGVDLDEHEVLSLDRREKPLVCLGGSGGAAARLSVDDRAVGQLATEHLLHLGHTRIAHLAGTGAGRPPTSVQGQRRQGFLDAIASARASPRASGAHPRGRDEHARRLHGGPAAARASGSPPHRPLRGIRRDGLRRDPRRGAARHRRARRPLGHRRRRARVRRDVRAHDDRAVPRRAGPLAVDVVLRLLDEATADPLPDSGAPLPTRLVVRSTTSAPR